MVIKSPNPIDVHVGSRVRLRRMIVGMSQEKLGEKLGLTFQQVQKYEKGTNRIGAGRLHDISNILSVPISYFYDDAPHAAGDMVGSAQNLGFAEPTTSPFVMDFVTTQEGLQLNIAFNKIKNTDTRKKIVDLVKSLAAVSENDVSI